MMNAPPPAKTNWRALAALIFATACSLLAAPAAHAYPGADEGLEICVENKNRGGWMSFYVFPADPNTGKRSYKVELWKARRMGYSSARRCFTRKDLRTGIVIPRGAIAVHYIVEHKTIGRYEFACGGGVFVKTDRPHQRVVYTIRGTTIYNTRCERTFEARPPLASKPKPKIARSEDEATEICFQNKNRGGNMSFYLFPADPVTGERLFKEKVWEAGHKSAYTGRHCMTAADMRPWVSVRQDALATYYTAEGKWAGQAHFPCGKVFLKKDAEVQQRAVYTIHGTTVYNTRCERTTEIKGRFRHPHGNDEAAAVSDVCFVSRSRDSRLTADFRLARSGKPAKEWSSSGGKPSCTSLDQIKGLRPGDELVASVPLVRAGHFGQKNIPCAAQRVRVRAPKSGFKWVATFSLHDTSRRDVMRCERINHIERK